MISFAQNAEDVLISRFFQGEPPQYYVDVGAADPIYHSVTKHFYDSGWSGLNIEPRQRLFSALLSNRPRDLTLQCCVSDESGTMKFFEVEVGTADETSDNGGLSTVDASLASDYRSRGFSVRESVREVFTLSEVLDRHSVDEIGFLKVDVEGHEPQVVAGLDWKRWRPRLVILESTIPLSAELADQRPTRLIEDNGYELVFFDGLNQFLVREEDSQKIPLLRTPANVFDNFVPNQHLAEVAAKELEIRRLASEITELKGLLKLRQPLWKQLFRSRKAA